MVWMIDIFSNSPILPWFGCLQIDIFSNSRFCHALGASNSDFIGFFAILHGFDAIGGIQRIPNSFNAARAKEHARENPWIRSKSWYKRRVKKINTPKPWQKKSMVSKPW